MQMQRASFFVSDTLTCPVHLTPSEPLILSCVVFLSLHWAVCPKNVVPSLQVPTDYLKKCHKYMFCFVLFFQKRKNKPAGHCSFLSLKSIQCSLFFHWFQNTYSECHWFHSTFLVQAQFVVVCIIWGECFTSSCAARPLSYSHSPHWTYRG